MPRGKRLLIDDHSLLVDRLTMMNTANETLLLRAAAVLLICCTPLLAQEPPAGDAVVVPPDAADAPPADVAADATAASGDVPDTGPALETNPAVRAALELPREEPADYFQAIGWLIDLGRPELAKPILDELAKLQLTGAQQAALVGEFGSHSMLKLARAKELAPTGGAFADACMAAANAASSDPRRVAQLVEQLTDASAEVRQLARNDLAAVGQPGVTATLEALAREANPQHRDAFAAAAADMRPLVVGPLLAMLSTSDQALRIDVGRLLQHLGVAQAVPFLQTSEASAERSLESAMARYSAGTPPFAPDEQNQIELWFWNDATSRLTSARYQLDEARIIWTARLARALGQLRPESREYQQRAWLLGLEAAGLIGTTQQSLMGVDIAFVNVLLADALNSNYAYAAVAAIDALAQRGDPRVLLTANAELSPLAEALVNPNPKVRFAALRAIMTLDPTSPYPGSSRVPQALAWFADSTGQRRALVAMPTNLAATDLAGKLAAHNLDAEATNRGRDAVDMAHNMADLEMIFVDMNILVPEVRQVLFELRAHPTTAAVPISLLAADGRLEAAERLAGEHRRVIAVPRLHSPEVLARTVEELNRRAGRDAVPPNERAAQAVDAMGWLARLLSANRDFYDLSRAAPAIESALYNPTAPRLAMAALARLDTPESQRALIDFASESTLPIESRSHAIEAFRASVAANGLLLTSDEILAQYKRYNASETADAPTQQALGAILDIIESRRDASRPATLPAP